MHAVNITNVYQYTPVMDDVEFFEQIKSLKELKEEEYDKEIIGSDNEHISNIYTVKRDDDDKSQGGVVSLVVCDKTMHTQPRKPWWTKTCGSRTQEPQVMSHIAELEE
jgi:hypothetical protein